MYQRESIHRWTVVQIGARADDSETETGPIFDVLLVTIRGDAMASQSIGRRLTIVGHLSRKETSKEDPQTQKAHTDLSLFNFIAKESTVQTKLQIIVRWTVFRLLDRRCNFECCLVSRSC